MEECKNCQRLEAVIQDLQRRRFTLFSTLRLLRSQLIQQMEAEHTAEQAFIASLTTQDRGGRITAPVE